MSNDEFNSPGSASRIDWNEHKGRLLLFTVKSLETGVPTQFGDREAIRTDMEVLDGPNPERFIDAFVFPKVLQSQLRSSVGGQRVLGRLGQGEAKTGQARPWKLLDPTEDDKTIARKHLAETEKPPF